METRTDRNRRPDSGHRGKVEGAVLVKQSANKLLALQYETLQRFTILFLAVFIFLSLAILIFSTRLTYRVGRLQRETEQAASSEGRLLKDRIRAGARSSDELGNLTRSISLMLHNLGQYTRYLEKLPDTLAHELHNPLNVVNSSLENLQYNHRELTDDKHLQRARNGIGALAFNYHKPHRSGESQGSAKPGTGTTGTLLIFARWCRIVSRGISLQIRGTGSSRH